MTTRPGFIWSGTEWVSIGNEAAVMPVKYQTSAPSTPSTGDIWIDSNDDVPGIDTSQFLRWRKTAAGSETSLSGTDDTGLTLAYTANYEQVYLNGVLLVRGQDYTATNGTSITGLTALAANDVVEVFGVVARVVGDVYTQAQTTALLNTKSLVSTTGLVLVSSQTFSAVTSVSFNNVFTSDYTNYRIVTNVDNSSAWQGLRIRMRLSGTDNTSSNYRYGFNYATSAASGGYYGVAGDTFGIAGNSNATYPTASKIDIYDPQTAKYTHMLVHYMGGDNVNWYSSYGGCEVTLTTQFDGFTIYPSTGNITGTIKVYGYK